MPKSILILDDDETFNTLLTDIFAHADYSVTSIKDPELAIESFKNHHYDLVVTDQKMPKILGIDFIKQIKNIRPEIPCIMVSGYLDPESIRQLVKEGVGGVFLKPLNVFSLLDKTAELLKSLHPEIKKGRTLPLPTAENHKERHSTDTLHPCSFKAFPCNSPKTNEFAYWLYTNHNFKTSLVLIAPPGTHLKEISFDLNRFPKNVNENFVFLNKEDIEPNAILKAIKPAEHQDRITIVTPMVTDLSPEQLRVLEDLVSKKNKFEEIKKPMRFLFFFSKSPDRLIEENKIPEGLYLFLGTLEFTVPKLSECPEDVPILAQHLVTQEAKILGRREIPKLNTAALTHLAQQSWPNNFEELKALIEKAVKRATNNQITEEDLKKASESTPVVLDLKTLLKADRDDYMQAVYVLTGYDIETTKALLRI